MPSGGGDLAGAPRNPSTPFHRVEGFSAFPGPAYATLGPMTIHISTAARNAAATAAIDLVDGGSGPGKVRIYSGTQPAGPDTAVTSQTLLAEAALSDPAFAAVSNGVRVMDNTPIPAGTGLAAGTAAWFRILDSNNVAVIDGSAGTSGTDLVLNTAAITVGVAVEITSGSLTMPG